MVLKKKKNFKRHIGLHFELHRILELLSSFLFRADYTACLLKDTASQCDCFQLIDKLKDQIKSCNKKCKNWKTILFNCNLTNVSGCTRSNRFDLNKK